MFTFLISFKSPVKSCFSLALSLARRVISVTLLRYSVGKLFEETLIREGSQTIIKSWRLLTKLCLNLAARSLFVCWFDYHVPWDNDKTVMCSCNLQLAIVGKLIKVWHQVSQSSSWLFLIGTLNKNNPTLSLSIKLQVNNHLQSIAISSFIIQLALINWKNSYA